MCFADRVFGPATTTRHVYDVAAQHVVSGAMQGINGQCFVPCDLLFFSLKFITVCTSHTFKRKLNFEKGELNYFYFSFLIGILSYYFLLNYFVLNFV